MYNALICDPEIKRVLNYSWMFSLKVVFCLFVFSLGEGAGDLREYSSVCMLTLFVMYI